MAGSRVNNELDHAGEEIDIILFAVSNEIFMNSSIIAKLYAVVEIAGRGVCFVGEDKRRVYKGLRKPGILAFSYVGFVKPVFMRV